MLKVLMGRLGLTSQTCAARWLPVAGQWTRFRWPRLLWRAAPHTCQHSELQTNIQTLNKAQKKAKYCLSNRHLAIVPSRVWTYSEFSLMSNSWLAPSAYVSASSNSPR